MSRLHCNVSSLASLEKTIEVDRRVPGNRDELPFPQAKQCSPECSSPSFQFFSSSDRSFRHYQSQGKKTCPHKVTLSYSP